MIYPKTVKEAISDTSYTYNLNLLTLYRYEIKKIHGTELHAYDYLAQQVEQDWLAAIKIPKAFEYFLKEPVMFTSQGIAVGNPADKRLITKEDFTDFQNVIREMSFMDIEEPIPENENPFQRDYRQAKERGKAAKAANGISVPFEVGLASLLCSTSLTLTELYALPIFAYKLISKVASATDKYNKDYESILAGVNSKSQKVKLVHPQEVDYYND